MRVAMLLDPPTDSAAADELVREPEARMVLLPHAARVSHALRITLGAFGASDDDVVVLRRVGDGVVSAADWGAAFEERTSEIDDDAAVESRIADASCSLFEGRLEEAEMGYLLCDGLLADELSPRHAEVLVCLAGIATSHEDEALAIERADRALAMAPMHRGAIAARLLLARRGGDSAVAAAMAQRQLALAVNDDERVALLNETADHGLRLAVESLQEALRVRPGDAALLERLRAAHEAAQDWERAVDVAVAAAERIPDAPARALAFVAAADTSAVRARNVGRAVALYEAAISDDPEVPGAFDAIEKVLLDANDYAGAEQAYARHVDRLAGRPVEAALLDKLARVREEHLGDRRGAIQALDRLVSLRPDDVDALGRLARLLEENGEDELSAAILEVAAQHAPGRVETFRALTRIHSRQGEADRAYVAAGVLVHLGEADLDEQLVYQQFAPEVGVRPTQPLDDASWRLLVPRELEGGPLALLSAIAPAAIEARLEQLRAKKAAPALDAREKQDVERTTVSAVRMAAWVAKLLGIPTPDVYLRTREVAGGVAVLETREPALALGPSILSGRSVIELSFLFAREMAQMRMTGRVMTFYPEVADLRRLVTAAIAIAVGAGGQLPPDVEIVRKDLARRLDPARTAAIAAAVRAIGDRGGQLDLLAWLRATERAACRAGLLACGDLTIAARVLSVDAGLVGGLSAADRVRDLVPFSVSPAYAAMRRALGISARASLVGDRWKGGPGS